MVGEPAKADPIDPQDAGKRATVKAAQRLNRSSGILAALGLPESAFEHYRGNFVNAAMVTPVLTSLIALGAILHGQQARWFLLGSGMMRVQKTVPIR